MVKHTVAVLCLSLLLTLAAHARPQITIEGSTASITTSRYAARFDGGSLVFFKDLSTGETLLQGDWLAPYVRFVANAAPVTAGAANAGSLVPRRAGPDRVRFTGSIQNGTSIVLVTIEITARENELIVGGRARATGKFEGLASMSFPLGATTSQTQLIVPTMGGNCYRSGGFRTPLALEWPIIWEAAMLQVQGRKGGLLICAYDRFTRSKNVELTPAESGWAIALESENQAPFEGRSRVQSLEWHIRPYAGEWRRGAAIYRDWHRRTFAPDPAEEPAWVQDIRAEIHCGTDQAVLDALVKAGVDPRQTLLYVAGWRTNHYDVNYPDYTPADHLAPFIRKAHELGFRVMLHANYFGCDPRMPDYARFRPFQIKHRYSGALQWWEWPKGEPPTKFAYINAASRDWRRFFVARMVEVARRTGADAIHLDQTLCIFNDRNGLIDGLTNAQGNLLLHEELKAALPGVAFSGEGLNEVTSIHEAFAQRHVAGIDHVNQTFSRASLAQSHPISSYLFGARTKPYEYLGSGSPDNDQFRLAWRDAYRRWGVLPGFGWPNAQSLADPSPSARQALDEMIAHQKHRLDPWIDAPWPTSVDFPYMSGSGEPFAYISNPDGWSLCRMDRRFRPVEELSRTVAGVGSVKLPGTIPGAICYDRERISGLDPNRYYVYFPVPRDLAAFHLECSDPDCTLVEQCAGPAVAFARTASSSTLLDLAGLLARSSAFYAGPDGKRTALTSDAVSRTGVVVQPRGTGLFMHPQWKGQGAGRGGAGIRFRVSVPKSGSCEFAASCRLDEGAVGKSDGVTFKATAQCGGKSLSAEAIAASSAPAPLRLDLSSLAGKMVDLELTAWAGPKHNPTCDWGLVEDLRVVGANKPVSCRPVLPGTAKYLVAPVFKRLAPGAGSPEAVPVAPGGVIMATSLEPADVAGSAKLARLSQCNQSIVSAGGRSGSAEESPVQLAPCASGGVELQALFAHPPDRGMRLLHYFVRLPVGAKAKLETAVGIRDGSKSTGVGFAVWLNGREHWSRRMLPADGWRPVELSLGSQNGDPVMLTLVTDSEGSFYYDWALWADPEIVIEGG